MLIFDHSATTYSALDVTPVGLRPLTQRLVRLVQKVGFFVCCVFEMQITFHPEDQWGETKKGITFCEQHNFYTLENGRPIGRLFLGHGRALWALG